MQAQPSVQLWEEKETFSRFIEKEVNPHLKFLPLIFTYDV